MRIRVSLDSTGLRRRARHGHPVELLVDAAPGSTFGQIRHPLARAAGLGDADRLTFMTNGRAVPPDAPVGVPPLVEGALLHVMAYAAGPAHEPPPRPASGLLELHVVSGPGAGRTVPLGVGVHVVGRSSACTIRLDDPGVSRRHLELAVSADGVRVRDLQPTNPSVLQGTPTGLGSPLGLGERLRVGSTVLELRRPDPASAQTTSSEGVVRVHRPPRFRTVSQPSVITFPESPVKPEGHRLPLISALVPLVLAGVMAMVMRTPVMLLFGLLSPVMLLGQWVSDRRHGRVSHRRALARHREVESGRRRAVLDALAEEAESRLAESPDLAVVGGVAGGPGRRLWERRLGDSDSLAVRAGVARQPARTTVGGEVPTDLMGLLVDGVPVDLDLGKAGIVGISGPRARVLSQCAGILIQLATWHSPRELRLVVLTNSENPEADWQWASRLPHAQPVVDGACLAAVASPSGNGARERLAELDRLVRERAEARTAEPLRPCPAVIVVLDGAHDLRRHPGVADLLRAGPACGVHFICLDEVAERLPSETVVQVELGEDRAPRATVQAPGGTLSEVVPDLPARTWVEQVSRSLAPLRDATPENGAAVLPGRVGFRHLHREGRPPLDPTDTASLVAHWSDPARPRAALLGLSTSGPYAVDLRSDGPHALVGGTTGAGKSELLRSLIAGLAVAHHPQELSLVLIDYKGGSAFKDCARLPHTVGLITDLDEHLAERALVSLKAEVKRRERVLAEHGAKDLDDYVRSRPADAPVVPRLLIVVDEFKVLADELPSFVDGLVRVAAVGRSLGVHLVLATQRPGGIVSSDMRANVALRIALRVRDRSDSLDVVESPEAASISDRRPGRALVRTAGLDLLEVQTAYTGGLLTAEGEHSPAAPLIRPLAWSDLAAQPPSVPQPAPSAGANGGRTELEAFVEAAAAAAEELGFTAAPSPWLPPLPALLPASAVPGPMDSPLHVALGLVDRPREQRQDPWSWDLGHDGHLALVGGPRTGRTTALRTIALMLAQSLPPSELHVHVLEGLPGPLRHLAALPHVGSVAGGGDAGRARRVIARLLEEVTRRRGLVSAAPRVVLLVDGWEQLEDAFESVDHGAPIDDLLRLMRDGLACGVSVAVTGGRALTGGRLSSLLSRRLVLAMPDPLDLTLAGVPVDVVPAHQGPGRAVDVSGGCEVQLAVMGSGSDRAGQDQAVADAAKVLRSTYAALPQQVRPWRIEPLPERVSLGDMGSPSAAALRVGVGGDGLDVLGFEADQRHLLVAGPPRSGRSTALATMARGLLDAGRAVAVVAPGRSPLTELDGIPGTHLFGTGDVDAFVALRREHPDCAILVDDADALDGTPLEGILLEAAKLVDAADGLLVIAADLHRASAAYRGLIPEVARRGTGLLLGARSPTDGEIFRVRVEPDAGRPPGRGFLIADGRATPVQVAAA